METNTASRRHRHRVLLAVGVVVLQCGMANNAELVRYAVAQGLIG